MTASAQRQARAELRWWRANRDAKHVFSEELRAARQVLAHGPKLEICGEPVRDPASPTHVTNPSVVVEVLSPSTEDYDRGEKREHYQRIASLREYVLVAQDHREIEIHARNADGGWQRLVRGPGQKSICFRSACSSPSTSSIVQPACDRRVESPVQHRCSSVTVAGAVR
jgi:hypothetical protein